MSGWIKIHRDINKHWIWNNSDYLKWWMDILLEANYSPAKVIIKGTLYECGRGEKLYSLDTWGKRWNTNKSKVRRFLDLLQKENMIVLKNETQTTRLTICKYDDYQENENESETQTKRKRNANESQMTPIKERKEKKENILPDIDAIDFDALLVFFNKTTGKNLRLINHKSRSQFNARIKEGYSKEDIAKAIINCSKDKYHIENPKYLTPEFISRPDKFEKYIDATAKKVDLPEDWFHRELTKDQEAMLTSEQKVMWKKNKVVLGIEGGYLRPIKK